MNESQHHVRQAKGLCLFAAMEDVCNANHLHRTGACPLATQAWAARCLKGCVCPLAMARYPSAWWDDDMSQNDVDELLGLLEEDMPTGGYWIC